MKKIIFLLLILPLTLNAQLISICNSDSTIGKQPFHSGNISMDFNNETPLVFNIFYHDDDPFVPIELTESDFLTATAYLNITYNRFNIFFKYRGFDTNSTAIDNMINVHIQNIPGGTGFPNGIVLLSYQAITNDLNKRSVFAHEIGHVLGLRHPRGATGYGTNNFIVPLNCNGTNITSGNFASTTSSSENVTRDEANLNFNADITGDFVVDTPATYNEVNLCINNTNNPPTLEYLFSNEVVDHVGEPYINIDVNNIMDDDFREQYFEFKTNFTDGQGVRMRETIENSQVLQDKLTTVVALYEPYQGNYFFAGPTLPNHRPLFQPGFDYKFVSCGGQTQSGYQSYNTPTDYDDISYTYNDNTVLNQVDKLSLDLNNINHPNRSAIVIEQLEDQPRKCYHNINRSAIGGLIIKFKDNIPNYNYTTTVKDSIGINQPTLIQDLENGLYIIQKNYDDGTQNQQTILKDNNE